MQESYSVKGDQLFAVTEQELLAIQKGVRYAFPPTYHTGADDE